MQPRLLELARDGVEVEVHPTVALHVGPQVPCLVASKVRGRRPLELEEVLDLAPLGRDLTGVRIEHVGCVGVVGQHLLPRVLDGEGLLEGGVVAGHLAPQVAVRHVPMVPLGLKGDDHHDLGVRAVRTERRPSRILRVAPDAQHHVVGVRGDLHPLGRILRRVFEYVRQRCGELAGRTPVGAELVLGPPTLLAPQLDLLVLDARGRGATQHRDGVAR
nr:hypothetical protein [Deltaproteobacteria bacterium]